MKNTLFKRIETLFNGLSSLHNRSSEHADSRVTCTRQRRLRELQVKSAVENNMHLIINRHTPVKTPLGQQNDCGRTVLSNSETLTNISAADAASIYFWRPNFNWRTNNNGERISRLMGERSKEPTDISADDYKTGNHSSNRNKESFVNFKEAALLAMAENSQTPSNTLRWLAAHHNKQVRESVASNENTTEETLWMLAEDREDAVRAAILENSKVSKDLAKKLANDKSFVVSAKASKVYYKKDMQSDEQPSSGTDSSTDNNPIHTEIDFIKNVAKSPSDSHRLFVQSAGNVQSNIRMLVAGDANATAEILWQVAKHPISQLKKKSVNKYNCLLETIVSLKGNSKAQAAANLSASTNKTIDRITPLVVVEKVKPAEAAN